MPEVLAGWEKPSKRLVPASRAGRPPLAADRGPNLLLPLPQLVLSTAPKEKVAAQCFMSSYHYLTLVCRPSAADVIALARHETRLV